MVKQSSKSNTEASEERAKNSTHKKNRLKVKQPQSAQELCTQLQLLSQQIGWDKALAEDFIFLIVNPAKQYQLDDKQKQVLISAVLNCPDSYRAFICFSVIIKNFISPSGLRTLDGIVAEIVDFIKTELALEHRIESSLLKSQGDQVLLAWLKEKLKDKKVTLSKKIDLLRFLLSYLIGVGEMQLVLSRLDIVLEAFAGSNYLQQYINQPVSLNKDIQFRVKAVSELFNLDKPSSSEAERLVLYGSYSRIIAAKQTAKLSELDELIKRNGKVASERERKISELEQYCKELEQELKEEKQKLSDGQISLEREKRFYEQLKADSAVGIKQERNSVLYQVNTRIGHELQKLERCFGGDIESFNDNVRIGMKIINKIREQLRMDDL
jgi:hypothetical protein